MRGKQTRFICAIGPFYIYIYTHTHTHKMIVRKPNGTRDNMNTKIYPRGSVACRQPTSTLWRVQTRGSQ